MVCKRCGTEFDGAFCPNCGERAEAKMTVCPVCGKERAEGENFCAKCGYAFEGQAAATQKPQAKITFDKEALIGGVRKFYKVALNIGKVFFSLLLFLILASPIMLHEGINTAGSGYTNAFNLYVDGRFTAVCAILMIIAFYSLIYGVYACVKFFVFRNREESKASKIIYFAANFLVFIVCCIGCSGAGDWFADAGAGLSFGIFVGIVGMALSVLRYLFEDKFVGSDGSQSVEVSDDVKAVEKKATKKVKLGTSVVTGALVIAVVITSIVQGVYTNPFSSASYDFAETRADVVKQFGMPENAKENSSSYTYYSTEYAAAERMIDALTEAQDKELTDGFESDADSFDEDDLESMFDGVAGIDGIIEKLEEKQDNIKYKKSVVTFNNDGGENRNNDTVKSYVCEVVTPEVEGEEKEERTLTNLKIKNGYYFSYDGSAEFEYLAKYNDGSFSSGKITLNSGSFDKNEYIYTFTDSLGKYTVSTNELERISGEAYVQDGILYIVGDTSDYYALANMHSIVNTIKKIEIKQGVTSVEFYGGDTLSNLEEISAPDSLVCFNISIIEDSKFYNNASNWENGKVLYIGNLLAEAKEDLSGDYTVREGTTAINENAFEECANLTSITIPDSVISMGYAAFSGCSSLESITLPFVGAKAGVTSSDKYQYPLGYIFGESSYAGGIEIWQDYGLDSHDNYYIPSSLRSVTVTGGNILCGAFYNCSMLTSITLGDGLTGIGDYAFRGCSSLTSFTFCENSQLESIGDYAFSRCSSLTSITIPASVTSIGSYAFSGCSSLTEINYNAISVADLASGSNVFSEAGKNTDGIKVVFGESVKKIPAYLFYYVGGNSSSYRPKVTSVTIGSNVTSIGSFAFCDCSLLTSITIPDSVTSIGTGAFYNCSSLTSVNFGENSKLESIGGSAFRDCSSLISMTIPDSVTSIGSEAFDNCSSLESVTFGENSQLESIGSYAFYNCSSLTSITIPASVTSIGYYAFYYNCRKLIIYCEAKSKPDSWDSDWSRGVSVVWDCNNNEVTSGGYIYYVAENGIRYALKDGSATVAEQAVSLSGDIEIPSSISYKGNAYTVTSIGYEAFYNCSSLTSITIPDSVTSIGIGAFGGCDSLTSVIFANTQGWWRSKSTPPTNGTSISSSDLADPATAAKYLTDTYNYYNWKRG